MVLSIISLVLLIVSVFGVWFELTDNVGLDSSQGEVNSQEKWDYKLFEVQRELRAEADGQEINKDEKVSYDDLEEELESSKGHTAMTTRITFVFILISMIFCVLTFIIGGIWLFLIKESFIKIVTMVIVILVVFLGFAFPLVSTIYFATSMSDSIKEDNQEYWEEDNLFDYEGFYGSDNFEKNENGVNMTGEMNWGPGYGWFLMLVTTVLMGISMISSSIGYYIIRRDYRYPDAKTDPNKDVEEGTDKKERGN